MLLLVAGGRIEIDPGDRAALARKNQLAVYTSLRTTKGLPADEELERRLLRTGGCSGSERSSPS